MKKYLLLFSFHFSVFFFSQNISGSVLSEDGVPLIKVLIVNMSSEQKSYTDANGGFLISAKVGDEIRFAKEGFEREKTIVSNSPLIIKLKKIPQEIEEVVIQNKKNQNYSEELREYLGLPKAPEKPREKPAEAVDDILFPILRIPPVLNVQAIYDVVSGKSKRQKRQYRYDDLQDSINWIRNNTDEEYYLALGIPKERINEFLMFCLRDPKIVAYVKAKNALVLIESFEIHIPEFLKRLKNK